MDSATHEGSQRPTSDQSYHLHSPSGSVSVITDSQLQKGLDYIKEGDRYRNRGDFDKAKTNYEKASKYYPSKAQDRLTILPLCKASMENGDSDRYIPTGLRGDPEKSEQPRKKRRFCSPSSAMDEDSRRTRHQHVFSAAHLHHAKEKVKQVLRAPPQISSPHHYFFPESSLSTQSTLVSLASSDSQSTSLSVTTGMSKSILATHSIVSTLSTLASEAVGIEPDVRSMTSAYKTADDEAREIILDKAFGIIKQFGKSRITFDTMQELVVLADIQEEDVFLLITTKILHVLRDMPQLSRIPLQGLAVILNSFPDEIDLDSLHGAFMDILKSLQARLDDIRTVNNDGQLLPLLIAINSLLDAMVRRKVFGLDRESIYNNLRTRLTGLTSHPDVMVCFQAMYAKQALVIIGNDESLPMSICRRGKLAFVLAGNISNMATKLDLASVDSAYQTIKEIFDFSIRDRWYQGLIYVDYLVGQHSWRQLEDFVLHSRFNSDVCFLLGIALRLEQIAVAQTDIAVSNGAIKFLIALGAKPVPLVPEMVRSTLLRLGISEGSKVGAKDDITVPILSKSSTSRTYQGGLRPVWDPTWHATPKGILLKAVQDRDLSAQFMDIRQAIQSSGSEVKGAADQIGADIQQLQANTSIISASLPSQSSLEDIQSALKAYHTYYAPLKVLRVSGDELDLETCFVNLAIVEAPAQQEKDKQRLKEQAATFHRIQSFEAVERSNMQSTISLEQLFDKRKLRDGEENFPKTILVQGRAGIGKTTLCKKIVHSHQTTGLWKDRFDAVLWLPLRDLRAIQSRTLEGLLREKYFFMPGLDQDQVALARAVAVGAQNGRILFILDGLDEIVTDTKCGEGIALRSFLRTLLMQQHVIVTSRPSGLDRSLLPSIDLELETVGFSQQNVSDFLVKVLKDPEALRTVQDFIQQTPVIQGLVNIPVQLDVICFSWDSLPTDGPMITMTGLYQRMVRKLWCKDALRLKKKAGGMDLTEEHISDLEPEEIDELMATELQHFGYVAFKGMTNNHQIEFDEKAIRSALRDLKAYREIAKVGLLPPQLLEMLKQTSFLHTADAGLGTSNSGSQQAWHFLHLTFQEYFAATWIAQHLQPKHPHPAGVMTVEQAKVFVQQHKYNPQYEIMWWMVAGLLEGEALEEFFGLLQGAPRDLIGGRHQQILASCLNEARARLDTAVVTSIEAELRKWLHFEIQTCHDQVSRSMLGSQSSFPEPLLVEDLSSVSSRKEILVNTLGARSILSGSAIQSLIDTLKDKDIKVRRSTAWALESQSALPASAIQPLIDAFKDESVGVTMSAVWALVNQSALPASAIQSLNDQLKDESSRVRQSAVNVLSQQSVLPTTVIQSLIDALKDESVGVRTSAILALERQSAFPTSAIQSLVDTLKDDYTHVRSLAAWVLAKQSTLPASAIQSLIDQLKDEDADVRGSAASALESQSALPASAIQSLIDTLKDKNTFVRDPAEWAFSNQSALPASAIQSLIDQLKDEDADVRGSAAWELAKQSALPAI
ncbi:hypothetical protein EDD11_005147 [Mortierella claussenii]|nr:hypothetical protein EDD11_005147 [Mortierella claussenii]